MAVKDFMTRKVVYISPDTTVSHAADLMREQGLHRLPVIENDQLVGLVTEGTIAQASPSKATSLSIYEMNYLLNKNKSKRCHDSRCCHCFRLCESRGCNLSDVEKTRLVFFLSLIIIKYTELLRTVMFSKPFLKLLVMVKKEFVCALLQKMKLVSSERLFL